VSVIPIGTSGVGNLLAAGGTARVYAGSYKGHTLAIKVIFGSRQPIGPFTMVRTVI
jgi:predicted Ser/Thr protein kinase